MKNIKILLMVLFFGTIFLTQNVSADGFVINFYYDSQTKKLNLVGDKDERVFRDKNANTSIVEFSKDDTEGPYSLKLYDANGINFSISEFDKKEGSFQLIIPYFSIAAKMEIVENSSGKIIATEDLKNFMTCNGNGVCDPNIGENDKNCMGDCLVGSNKSPRTETLGADSLDSVESKVDSNPEEKSFWDKFFNFFSNLFK